MEGHIVHILLNGNRIMKIHKLFCVVAYDVANTRRRNKVVKMLSKYGKRINYSVYECMFTQSQYAMVKKELLKILLIGKDVIAIYPICLDCYAKAEYLPKKPLTIGDIVSIL